MSWDQGQLRRRYRSPWIIDRMRRALPLEYVLLAERWLALQASLSTISAPDSGGSPSGRNGAQIALERRLDAAGELAGYTVLAAQKLNERASLCVLGIACGDSPATLARRLRMSGAGRDRQRLRGLVRTVLALCHNYHSGNVSRDVDVEALERADGNCRGFSYVADGA